MASTSKTADEALAHARALLQTMPLVDGHNDLPLLIRVEKEAKGDVAAYGLNTRRARGDTDIPRLREGCVSAQFFAAFIFPNEKHQASFALQQIALVQKMNALHADTFYPATRSSDIIKAKRLGKIASFITIENGGALENRLDTLEMYYQLGVRLMTLCHNATTDWCDSATDAPRHGGLTEFGKDVLREMNRLGMIIDLAHVTPAVMHQALDISTAPLVWSHSNAQALCDHPRNVPDDVLDRVKANNGIVMATFVPDFISQKSRDWTRPMKDKYGKTLPGVNMDVAVPAREKELGPWPRGTLNEYCEHLDYLVARMGINHVGIGSDFFGGPQGEGLKDVACFPHVLAELIRRGWPDTSIRKLASGNFLRVMRAVEKAAAR